MAELLGVRQYLTLQLPDAVLGCEPSEFARPPTGLRPWQLRQLNGASVPMAALGLLDDWTHAHVVDEDLVVWHRFLMRRATGCPPDVVREMKSSLIARVIAVMWHEGWLRKGGPRSVDDKDALLEELERWLRRQAEAWELGHPAAKEEADALRRLMRRQKKAPAAAGAATPQKQALQTASARARRLSARPRSPPPLSLPPPAPAQPAPLPPAPPPRPPQAASSSPLASPLSSQARLRFLTREQAEAQLLKEKEIAKQARRYPEVLAELQTQMAGIVSARRKRHAQLQTDLGVPAFSWITNDLLRGFINRLQKAPELMASEEVSQLASLGKSRERGGMLKLRVLFHALTVCLWLWDKNLKRNGRTGIFSERRQGRTIFINLKKRVQTLEEGNEHLLITYADKVRVVEHENYQEVSAKEREHGEALRAQEERLQMEVDAERAKRVESERLCKERVELAEARKSELEARVAEAEQRFAGLQELLCHYHRLAAAQRERFRDWDAEELARQLEAVARTASALDSLSGAVISTQLRLDVLSGSDEVEAAALVGASAEREAELGARLEHLAATKQRLANAKRGLLSLGAAAGLAEGRALTLIAERNREVIHGQLRTWMTEKHAAPLSPLLTPTTAAAEDADLLLNGAPLPQLPRSCGAAEEIDTAH